MFAPQMQLADTQQSQNTRQRHDGTSLLSVARGNLSEATTPVVCLGKVRGSSLPQEYELARLIADVRNSHSSWNVSIAACKWQGVTCDEELRVTQIYWTKRLWNEYLTYVKVNLKPLAGPLHWHYLPRTLLRFSVASNKLIGTVPLDSLPPDLLFFYASDNTFTGELNLTSLPLTLKGLSLKANMFEGCVDFTQLPPNLTFLTVSGNELSGIVDLSSLPDTMFELDLSNNQFEGPIVLGEIPSRLEMLKLENNAKLCGEIDVGSFDEKDIVIEYSQTNIRAKMI